MFYGDPTWVKKIACQVRLINYDVKLKWNDKSEIAYHFSVKFNKSLPSTTNHKENAEK